jgi:superfamily I DNA/RNA helicase
MKKIKARFVVGPPGTGKTHIFLLEKYKECFLKYNPEKIILISHTNTAVKQILDAVRGWEEVKKGGYKKDFFTDRICTIHHYCKVKLKTKSVFEDDAKEHFKNLCVLNAGFRLENTNYLNDLSKYHPFFKYINHAHGKGKILEQFWKSCDYYEYEPYNLPQLLILNEVYEDYKKEHSIYDFADMIKEFNESPKESDIEVLIVDEAQDTNVPQLKAVNKMAQNIKDNHFYMVGDPDQTIFEFSGSDADYFHKEAAKPWKELKEGLRCSEVINEYCKKIIKPVWNHYKYQRTWTPTKEEGYHYYLADLNPSKNLQILLEKIQNTDQTFLFTFRGKPSDKRIRNFLISQGIEFAHIGNSAYVSKKEFRCHDIWEDCLKGKSFNLQQLRDFWKYLGSKAVPRGKGKVELFDNWINKDYTIDELVAKGFLKENIKQLGFFDLVRKRTENKTQQEHEERMLYIKKVIREGFTFDKKTKVQYGNIHQIKGTTFDNVIVDLTVHRAEPWFVQLRLKYTAFSRGVFDCWSLCSVTGFTLGER